MSMIDTLRDYLLDYSQAADPAEREAIESKVWRQFGAERAVLVLDMSGFSLLTRRHGVIHYLSMVRRMQETVRPIVHDHEGSIVKFEADNGFAVFPDPESAIRAAIEMNRVSDRQNAEVSEEYGIHLSCGIDHGRILLIEGRDFFGDPVNTASKLGEDLADPGEILVTRTAMKALGDETDLAGNEIELSLSGIRLEACSIAY